MPSKQLEGVVFHWLDCSPTSIETLKPVSKTDPLTASNHVSAFFDSTTKPLHEAITHKHTGELVDFFDSKALADATHQLIKNDERCAMYSAAARQFAIENYDLKKVCLPKQVQWVESLADL